MLPSSPLLCHYCLTTTLVTYHTRSNIKFQKEKCVWLAPFLILSKLMHIYYVFHFYQFFKNVWSCLFTDLGLENDLGLPNGKQNQKNWLCMAWSLVWNSGFRSGARANPPAHCDRWMVGDQETVICQVLVSLRRGQLQLIFFCCLILCGLLVLVSLPTSMIVCKLEFAFALEEGMWVHVHIIEKCLGFWCLCGE